MPYKRQVRCSYCYETGHNTNGCEKKKEYIKNNPDSYYAREASRRAERRKSIGKRCSYCNIKGHTRRTCEVLKADKANFLALTKAYRKIFVNACAEDGLGIGALVATATRKDYDSCYPQPKNVSMISAIRWQHINAVSTCGETDNPFTVKRIESPSDRWGATMMAPKRVYVEGKEFNEAPETKTGQFEADRYGYNTCYLISPVPTGTKLAGAPEGWYEGTDEATTLWAEQHIFAKGAERKYWMCYDPEYRAEFARLQDTVGVKNLPVMDYYESDGTCLVVKEEAPKKKRGRPAKKGTKKKTTGTGKRGRKPGSKDKKKRVRRTNAQLRAAGLK